MANSKLSISYHRDSSKNVHLAAPGERKLTYFEEKNERNYGNIVKLDVEQEVKFTQFQPRSPMRPLNVSQVRLENIAKFKLKQRNLVPVKVNSIEFLGFSPNVRRIKRKSSQVVKSSTKLHGNKRYKNATKHL